MLSLNKLGVDGCYGGISAIALYDLAIDNLGGNTLFNGKGKSMIAHRRGHNFQAVGSKHYINEVEENEKINNSISKYLDVLGVRHIDVSPPNMSSQSDLIHSCNKANQEKAEIYLSIHFNAYQVTNKAMGTEVWVYDKTNFDSATRVFNSLVGLGFKKRSIKENKNFFELYKTNCKAMIIEICFVDSKEDVDLYRKIGHDKIAKTIVEAITQKKIPSNYKEGYYRVIAGSYKDKDNAITMQNKLEKHGIDSFLEYKEV